MRGNDMTPGLDAPRVGLTIGITGHRAGHPVVMRNHAAIKQRLEQLAGMIERLAIQQMPPGTACIEPDIMLVSLLANGIDLDAAGAALERGWAIASPLPFGRALNLAINALPDSLDDALALLDGKVPGNPVVAERARQIAVLADKAQLFELAEQDTAIEQRFLDQLRHPEDAGKAQAFTAACSERAAVGSRVMIDHADLLIGVWDGMTHGFVGGTRHTIETALDQGVPVLWVDAGNPQRWQIISAAEELAGLSSREPGAGQEQQLAEILGLLLQPQGKGWPAALDGGLWRASSSRLLHAYRRIETLFGEPMQRPLRSLRQHYEHPDAIAAGSAAGLLSAGAALPGGDAERIDRIGREVLRPFAWASGISTWLSDAYRGSMVASFFLSALAIAGGLAYLPIASVEQKWAFALFEFVVLVLIVAIFLVGKKRRWHERWFETRRIAEYFRHAPILLLLGGSRSAWRWPRGAEGNWPEWYVRHSLAALGLPRMRISAPYLRDVLALMRDHHVLPQKRYHDDKARRLIKAQHNLHRLSEGLFVLAALSVGIYLAIAAGAGLGWLPSHWPADTAKLFTFFGVLFPTLGGAFAGVHYFGDFERFAAISEVTAEKLSDVTARIGFLLEAHDGELSYARVATLAHAIDDIVISEIENWQAVFGGKHITVPV